MSAHGARPTLDDVRRAEERLRGRIVKTGCSETEGLGLPTPCRLHLKLENQQKTGSFKERGALNRLLTLSESERRRGVIAASAGNHGMALAFHGEKLGVPVTVVMPETAPLVKVANTRGYGARVVLHGKILDESAERAKEIADAEGSVRVPAFDDPDVIAGQGTVALEILESVPSPAWVVVPVGGGGLIGGIAVALKALVPGARVIGVEAAAAPSAHTALAQGGVVTVQPVETLADGIATKRIGQLTYPLLREHVDDLVLVSEDEIASAILLLLERARTVVEGAGAVGLAALMAGRIEGIGPRDDVVVVLSGGNIDVTRMARIIGHGLAVDGRLARLSVRGPDRPGLLARIAATVARMGGNIMEVDHERDSSEIAVGSVGIEVVVESEGRDHAERIARALGEEGLQVTPLQAHHG
jgi:threonine dehydratase